MKRLGGAIVLLLLVLLNASSASAAGVGEVGWWTRSPAASAPDGGIAVSNAPDGPVSVAAIRMDLGDGVQSATLTLPQTGGATPNGAQLVVCVTDSPWTAVSSGAIADAPATTCDGTSSAVQLSGTNWTADVGSLVAGRSGLVAFAVVPTTGSSGVWELQFGPPAVQATATPAARPTATTAAPRTTPTTAYAPAPARPAPTFSTPPPPAVSVTATTAAITPTTIDNFVSNIAPSSEVAFGGASSADDEPSEGRPIGQAIFFVVMASAIGVVAATAHKLVTNRQLAG